MKNDETLRAVIGEMIPAVMFANITQEIGILLLTASKLLDDRTGNELFDEDFECAEIAFKALKRKIPIFLQEIKKNDA